MMQTVKTTYRSVGVGKSLSMADLWADVMPTTARQRGEFCVTDLPRPKKKKKKLTRK